MTAENVLPLRHPRGSVSVPGLPGWAYETGPTPGISRTRQVKRKRTDPANGEATEVFESVQTPVLDWCPLVTARLVSLREDGAAAGVYYRVTVGEDTGTFSHSQITSGEIWERMPDAYGTGPRQIRDVLTSVITGQAVRLPRTLAVTRTGWHTTADDRMYVYPNGRTWPEGGDVDLIGAPERLSMAAEPVPACDDARVREDLAAMAAHGGWAPLVGLAAGARALGQSFRPVPAALVFHGDPGTGKSCSAAPGRMLLLSNSWPPLATARMSDTPTDLEVSVDFEADMPTLLDDLALTGTSSALDQRKAVEQLERIIRPLGNQEAIRGRRNRDLTAQTRRYVRSIATLTAQQLPVGMQASLYRRAVVLHLTHGAANTTWWKPTEKGGGGGADRIGPALRTIGDRIIARLGEADDPAALLADAERVAFAELLPAVDAAIPGWVDSRDGLTGVIDAAGQMLAGLVLVAESAGIEPRALLAGVVEPMARALAEQAYVMDDRRRAADDLPSAVGDILRAALLSRRAHVRDHGGDLRAENGPPGLTPQEMGLREAGRDLAAGPVWEGYGPPLYWLPDVGPGGAVGVRREALYDLIRAAGDTRAAGYTPASLVAALGRVGVDALLPSPERGRAWSVNHRLTGATKSVRMIWLKPSVVWPDLGDTDEGGTSECPVPPANLSPTPTTPTPELPPTTTTVVEPSTSSRKSATDAGGTSATATAPPPDTGSAPAPTPEVRPASPVLAMGCDRDVIYLGDGRDREPADAYASMPALLATAAELMPDGGTVAVTTEVAELLGYPSKPANTSPGRGGKRGGKTPQECRAVTDARAAGWQSSAAGVGAWTTFYAPGRESFSVVVPAWLDRRRMGVSGEIMLNPTDDMPTVAYLLARYTELTGGPWVMTAGTSGTGLVWQQYTRPRPGRRRRTPRLRWDGTGSPAATDQEQAAAWDRPLSAIGPAEKAMPSVVGFDAVCAYLAAAGSAELAVDVLTHTGLPGGGFDPRQAGYWQIPGSWMPSDPRMPAELLPRLTGGDGHGPVDGLIWRATPTVRWLLDLGMPEQAITDAWLTGQGTAVRLLRGTPAAPGWADRIRDAYNTIPADVTDPEEQRVRTAVKATFRETIGMFRRGTPFVMRGDWADTVIATARTNLLRRVVQIGAETGRWPLRVETDCVYYATATETPWTDCPEGLPLAPHNDDGHLLRPARLGEFTVKSVTPMAEFLATDVRGNPRNER